MEYMLNQIFITVVCPLFLILFFGCDVAKSKRSNYEIANGTLATPQPTQVADSRLQNESAASLCNRLHKIKKLPYRDPNDTDPMYEALIAKGKEAMPCLIEKITDDTSMPDPRESPPWRHYKVGDTAVFILLDIATKDEDLLPEMLPPKYKKEWETNGVYAYFNYVSESKNRKELQKWWQTWMKENLNKIGLL